MKKFISLLVLAFLNPLVQHSALACAICFGDPNSQMSKGVIAGVVVLVGVVGSVLGGILAVSFSWIARARRLEKIKTQEQILQT